MQFNNSKELVDWIEHQRRFSKRVTLDKMLFLAKLFDNPQNKFKSIHVTGTNGKGTTVAYLRSIFESQGLKVGSFTSPYIICFNERIYFDGKFISDDDILKYGNLILSKYDELDKNGYEYLNFFEFITMMCFLYFAEKKPDIVVIEVGIGGRLDATNIITPLVSVITNVSYDHMAQLGPTLKDILKEKLGIVKAGVPLVTSIKDKDLLAICDEECKNKGSKCVKVDFESLRIKKMDLDGSVFSYKDFDNVRIKMIGEHQIENACLVLDVVDTLKNCSIEKKSNFDISNEILYEGLISCKWPGRFELMSKDPLIYIDGGHNIGCVERICSFIKTLKMKNVRGVIAISADKELDKMIKLIDETFDEVIFTHFTYQRSSSENVLFDLSHHPNKKMMNDIDDIIKYVNDNKTDLTVFLGSLYFVSEIRPKLLKI